MKQSISINRKGNNKQANVETAASTPVIETANVKTMAAEPTVEPGIEMVAVIASEQPASLPAQQLQNNLFPSYSRKLSFDIAMTILRELRKGTRASALAKLYAVDSSTISDIKVGRLYKKALEAFKLEVANEATAQIEAAEVAAAIERVEAQA